MSNDALFFNASDVKGFLPWRTLIDSLNEIFRYGCHMPLRHHHTVHVPSQADGTLLLMPAWIEDQFVGVKLANVFPDNCHHQEPSVSAAYLLSSAKTGRFLAFMDGGELTARRTAAASVLAAGRLASKNASQHLMVGTGRLSGNVIQAYAATFNLERFRIWGRNYKKCLETAEALKALGIPVEALPESGLDQAVAEADIISTATLSQQPLIHGDLLKAGAHVDLIGGFTPFMREADDDVIRKSSIFVDTREGAIQESGDIMVPLQAGVISESDIQADLYELCRGQHPGRQSEQEITLFKSVGAACEDLAAAILVYKNHMSNPADVN